MRDARVLEGVRGELDLHLGVGLGGTVEDAHGLGIGQQLVQQVDLVGDGGEVRRAGDVAAGSVVGVNQAALRIVGDGGTHHGNVGGGAGDRLRGGRGDGKDQVVAVVHELARDGLAGGLVVLRVLLINLGVDARLFDGGHEALVGLVQRAVLGELQHADLVGSACGGRAALAGRGALCGGAAAATSQGTRGKQARSKGDEIPARDAQHGDQLRFLCSGLRSRGEALYREKACMGYTSALTQPPPQR